MFASLRKAFRQAVENFQSEVNRDRIPDAADRLLRAMRAELIELQRQSEELERELEAVQEGARREHEATKTCLRREEMARKIDDKETASVARGFAGKHLQRQGILFEKSVVLTRELHERRENLEEMKDQFQEALLRRESLGATAGRTHTSDHIRQTDDLFQEMDSVAERIKDLETHTQAPQDIDETLGDGSSPAGDALPEHELDARLEALKKRVWELPHPFDDEQ